MNRLVTTNLDGVCAQTLPPRESTERVRLLAVVYPVLGFVNHARQLARYTDQEDGLDAVHVHLGFSRWQKPWLTSVPALGRWNMSVYRHMRTWPSVLRRWFRERLDLSRFDVVFIANQGQALVAPEVQRDHQLPVAVNLDTTGVANVRDLGVPSGAEWLRTRAERRIFRTAALLTPMCEWAARSLRDDFDVPSDRIHRVRSCQQLPTVAAEPGRTTGPCHWAFVGHDWRRKGGPGLLRLHQEAFADRAVLHVFSGGAPVGTEARNVVWHGATAHEDLIERHLPAMDLFVLPTSQDMAPWAVLEAASVGLPVVSSRLAAIPEYVVSGETGLLREPGDWPGFQGDLDRLTRDPQLRGRLGAAARTHVERHFDPDVEYGRLARRLVDLGLEWRARRRQRTR